MDLKLMLLLLACVGCGPASSSDSAAVHIDKLREEISSLRRERNALQEDLIEQGVKYDQLILATSRFKAAAIQEPALAIGRYLRAVRRFKFDIAKRHPNSAAIVEGFMQDPLGGAFFLMFATPVREVGGEVPEGVIALVDLSMLSSSETRDFADIISLDKAIAKAASEDEINRIYFDREMERLGDFAGGIVSP